MATWFTADWHLGHMNSIRLDGRPFLDLDRMAHEIFQRYRECVADGDTVYHLGDFAFGSRKQWWWDIHDLPGYKILVPGNHDANWQEPKHDRRYLDAGFDLVIHSGMIRIGEHNAVLSHLPTNGDSRGTDRFVKERLVTIPDKTHLICGHVHNAWTQSGPNINVGVTIWDYYPVHADTIANLIEEQDQP